MNASYSPLNQGQANDRSNQPNVHSQTGAPIAKPESEAMDGNNTNNENGNKTSGNNSENSVPHVVITEPHDNSNHNFEDHSGDEDEFDGKTPKEVISLADLRPHSAIGRVPHLGLNLETELGSIAGETIPDINVYQHKKTLAQGMMDLALFSANANQLRYVLDSYSRHPYYWPSLICIILSLGLQIGVGVGLIWNALYDIKNDTDLHKANRVNNFTVTGIFLVVVLNVFISVFAVDNPAAAYTILRQPGSTI